MPRLARACYACFTPHVPLPYKIATLLYCFNERDEVLLLEQGQLVETVSPETLKGRLMPAVELSVWCHSGTRPS